MASLRVPVRPPPPYRRARDYLRSMLRDEFTISHSWLTLSPYRAAKQSRFRGNRSGRCAGVDEGGGPGSSFPRSANRTSRSSWALAQLRRLSSVSCPQPTVAERRGYRDKSLKNLSSSAVGCRARPRFLPSGAKGPEFESRRAHQFFLSLSRTPRTAIARESSVRATRVRSGGSGRQ